MRSRRRSVRVNAPPPFAGHASSSASGPNATDSLDPGFIAWLNMRAAIAIAARLLFWGSLSVNAVPSRPLSRGSV